MTSWKAPLVSIDDVPGGERTGRDGTFGGGGRAKILTWQHVELVLWDIKNIDEYRVYAVYLHKYIYIHTYTYVTFFLCQF